MKKELRELLQVVTEGNNDLMQETIDAAKKILAGGYEGHEDDVECIEGVETGFELERLLSQGKWYWQAAIKMKKISNKIKELKKELDEKNLKNATAAYAAIVEEVAKEYTDGTTVETLRKEHPEINFMDYDKIEKLLEHAKNERRRKKNEK